MTDGKRVLSVKGSKMTMSKVKQEQIAKEILQDKAKKKADYQKTYREEKARIDAAVNSRSTTPLYVWRPLAMCSPGTRFEMEPPIPRRGAVISVTPCSARVLFDDGTDTTISPQCWVFTGVAKIPPKPKHRPEVKADKPPETAPKGRPKLLGYTSIRLIYFLGSKGWDFDKVKLLFSLYEIPIADSTIDGTLNAVNNPKWFDPAKVTDEHYLEMERAVE
jgi:hypothetical protein